MRQAADDLSTQIGAQRACGVLGVPRSSLYRHRAQKSQIASPSKPRLLPERALSRQEKTEVLEVLNSDRFVDLSPRQVWAKLLDEGTYRCSWRSMYRILKEKGSGA